MSYYLKKFWRANLLAIVFQVLISFTHAGFSLLQIQMSQAIIDLDLRLFALWMTANILGWCGYFLLDGLLTLFQGRAVRKMNNAVRRDMAATLLQKSYGEYHAQDKGEYLSWLTNNVKQIENLAWTPFFNCVSQAASVVWSVLALLSLSWELLAVGLFSSAVMMVIPKLFQKRMERRSISSLTYSRYPLGEGTRPAEVWGCSR